MLYTLLRLLFFIIPFAGLAIMLYSWGWEYWPTVLFSTLIAAIVSTSLSVIFLSKYRSAASESIYHWRNRQRSEDDVVEDEAVDALTHHASDTSNTNHASHRDDTSAANEPTAETR